MIQHQVNLDFCKSYNSQKQNFKFFIFISLASLIVIIPRAQQRCGQIEQYSGHAQKRCRLSHIAGKVGHIFVARYYLINNFFPDNGHFNKFQRTLKNPENLWKTVQNSRKSQEIFSRISLIFFRIFDMARHDPTYFF